MEDLPLGRIAALVPEFAVKDLPLGRTHDDVSSFWKVKISDFNSFFSYRVVIFLIINVSVLMKYE